MKVLIGITQGLEQTRNFITREFGETGIITEIGPFRSFEDASRWEHYMTTRAGGYEQLTMPPSIPSDSFWYGITLEWCDRV